MKVTDLMINPQSVGRHLILTAIRPAYAYKDGVRTDEITGYRYDVVMPEHEYDRISVRIDGPQQLELGEGEHLEVAFDGLELFVYWMNGTYSVGARATGIHATKQSKTA